MNDKINNKFKAIDEEGKEKEFNVLFTFDSEETGKHYMVYTDNSVDLDGNINVFASTVSMEGSEALLHPIESEKEWDMIEIILEEIQNQCNA